ncbi:ATP-binding protein [Catellatospora vulcania]|uniref:ATP-binding protein n=1 Tax=Catellatospora vulcania TaxID=1460450 RepID=UPI0012D4BEDD|nr:ATP-binding protein [Catellatospora vulcania]
MAAVSIDLPGGLSSTAVAREFAGLLVRSWRIGHCRADILMLASELVSNAVLHGGGAVTMSLERTGEFLRIEVADRSPQPPVPRQPDVEGGFGMGIVHRLSPRWGVRSVLGGKVVWADYRLP